MNRSVRLALNSVLLTTAMLAAATSALAATPARVPSALVPVDGLAPTDMAGSGSSRSAADQENELEAPRVGEFAPDFELPSMDGSAVMRLSSFRWARPVLLVFGSYT